MQSAVETHVDAAPQPNGPIKAWVSLDNLRHALRVVAPAIPGASCSIPLLRSVRIEQLQHGLAVEATDSTASIRALIPETTKLPAAVTVASDRFIPWIGLLSGDTVKLSTTAARVSLQCGDPRASFPRLNFEPGNRIFEMPGDGIVLEQADLLRILKHARIAVSEDESRYTLKGMLLEGDGETLYAVATDGHRMVVYSRPSTQRFRFLIPSQMLRLLYPVIVEGKERVTLKESDSHILASVAADMPVFVNCGKITGSFPQWQAVLPKERGNTVTVDAQRLYGSLTRCLLMGDKDSHALVLEFEQNELRLHSASAQAGEADETIPAVGGPAKTMRIGANGTYLSQALRLLTGDIEIRLPKEANSAIVFYASPAEGETFNYIVMPLNIK